MTPGKNQLFGTSGTPLKVEHRNFSKKKHFGKSSAEHVGVRFFPAWLAYRKLGDKATSLEFRQKESAPDPNRQNPYGWCSFICVLYICISIDTHAYLL